MSTLEDLPPFATPAQVEAFTKGKIRAGDARVQDALAAVSADIRREAGWHIAPRVPGHVLTLDGPGGVLLAVPSMKIHAIVSIMNAGVPVDPVDGVDVSRETGLVELRDGTTWTRRYGQLVITLDHGWDRADELAAMTARLVARGLASPMGATREQAGALSVNWSLSGQGVATILPSSEDRTAIGRYRLAKA